MKSVILFDDPLTRQHLLPFAFTRPLADVRCGILTVREKWQWESVLPHVLAHPYLQGKYPFYLPETNEPYLYVQGALCPHGQSLSLLQHLGEEEAVWYGEHLIALRSAKQFLSPALLRAYAESLPRKATHAEELGRFLPTVWSLVLHNGEQIYADFQRITAERRSATVADRHSILYGQENIFLEEGASLKACVLNAEDGVIYVGKGAKISEGSLVRGHFALCEGAELAMGAKIKGDTTVGPFARVGGEVGKSIFFGRSNKIHDGYLGHSVIGEWCNLGAATNNSNLKNTYAPVKVWSYATESLCDTGEQFCGLFMGDHAKCSIQTMFNTGTVVGVAANVFGSGFPPKFIPSFSWGGREGLTTAQPEKMITLAQTVMERKGVAFSPADALILQAVFEESRVYRHWER